MSRSQIVTLLLMMLSAIGMFPTSEFLAGSPSQSSFPEDSGRLLTIDHYVHVRSTVPAIAGQPMQIYVRERAKAGTVLRGTTFTDRVVLFVHGAGTPAEVAFDVPYQDYSWMAYLANAGLDVFSMDMTGKTSSRRRDDEYSVTQ